MGTGGGSERRRGAVRRRLLIALTVFAAIAVLAFAVPLSLTVATSRTQQLELGRSGDADRFATLADTAITAGDVRVLADEVGRYRELYGENVLVIDAKGAPSVNAGADIADPDIVAAVAAARRNERPKAVDRLTPWGARTMLVARPIGTGVQVNGAVVIEASTARARTDIARAWAIIGVGAVLAMALFTALALTLSRWVLRPLAALSTAVAELTATLPKPRTSTQASGSGGLEGDAAGARAVGGPASAVDGVAVDEAIARDTGVARERRWGWGFRRRGGSGQRDEGLAAGSGRRDGSIARRYGGPPEMRAVAESFDAMALAVADSAAAQRQLVADTAHAMRNPLAALTIRLDSLEPAIPAGAASTFRGASAEVDRLTALLDGLLALAVAEAPAAFDIGHGADDHCDAVQVVADRVDAWHFAYEQAGLELRAAPVPRSADAAVSADVLAQILDVPLSNSCRYAGTGTRTTIVVDTEPGWVNVTVHDNGAGVAPDEIAKLTTRFFRGSTATAGGTGLGLPIAAALTQARGGTLSIKPAQPHGLAVHLRLPAGAVT